jgi:ribosomal protein L11
MDFCNLFNKITLDSQYKKGILINCLLIIYSDFSFDLKLKTIDLRKDLFLKDILQQSN